MIFSSKTHRFFTLALLLGVALTPIAVFGQTKGAEVTSPAVQATEAADTEAQSEGEIASASIDIFANHQEVSRVQVSYEDHIGFMNSYSVVDKGRVKLNYGVIKTSGFRSLVANIQSLRDIPVTDLSRTDQLAYWLNLRNMLVIFAVALDGSEDITEGRGTFDKPGEIWTNKLLHVQGVHLSIDDIERGIILKYWQDPNIFYGLYQGIKGGPPLFKPGFRGENVHDVLRKLGRRYVNGRKVIAFKSDTLIVPHVYDWYRGSLFADETKIKRHFQKLTTEKKRAKLAQIAEIVPGKVNYEIDTARNVKRRKAAPPLTPSPASQIPGGRGGRGGGSAPGRTGS